MMMFLFHCLFASPNDPIPRLFDFPDDPHEHPQRFEFADDDPHPHESIFQAICTLKIRFSRWSVQQTIMNLCDLWKWSQMIRVRVRE